MTHDEIRSWCLDHLSMASRDSAGIGANYIRTFSNGDTYEYREKESSLWRKTVEIAINGKLCNVSDFVYENFGWDLVSELAIV